MTTRLVWLGFLLLAGSVLTAGCGDDAGGITADGDVPMDADTPDGDTGGDGGAPPPDGDTTGEDAGELVVPDHYVFESKLAEGESAVAYSGQTFRQVLIADLTWEIDNLTTLINEAGTPETDASYYVGLLDFYLEFNSDENGELPLHLSTDPEAAQTTYNDVSSGKDLLEKLAGNDDATDHENWTDGGFVGWSDTTLAEGVDTVETPEQLTRALFQALAENAVAHAEESYRYDPTVPEETRTASDILPVHVTEDGRDLSQLTQKFVLMAVNFSQGTDDYLDDDVDGKGLKTTNAEQHDGDQPFTTLEHQWDEGFGYFGAARDYTDYEDEEIAGKGGREGWSNGYHDTDGDDAIDLMSEYNFAASTNCAKRDLGSADGDAPTDFTQQAFEAFVTGRALINHAAGRELTTEEMSMLQAQRDQAVMTWETCYAATVVHYINDTLQAMNAAGTGDYDYRNHAKVWSELKGFALGLQFNPRSPLSDDFAMFHELVGDVPVIPTPDTTDAELEDYADDLLAARALLQEAYGFDEANVGDDNGEGGW